LDSLNKKVTLDGSWFNFEDRQDRNFVNERYYGHGGLIPGSLTNSRSVSGQNIDIYSLKVDAELPFKKFALSTGGKLNITYNNSDVALFQIEHKEQKIDAANSNIFNYREIIQALYLQAHKEYKSWAFQIGMRGEKTQAKGISVVADKAQPYNYYRLFPTFFVSYTANEKNTFTVNYSRRINRPGYKLLNPFRLYLNPYAYAEGNPFLQPSYNHNAEFSHSYDKKLTTALSYILETDAFSHITLVENNSLFQVSKPLNFFTYQACQLTNTLSFSPSNWLETSLQSDVTFSFSRSNIEQTTWSKIKV